ncbi:MAG: hypothetical protein ABI824_08075 [Acidobacteriota bacterium]
MRLAATLCTIVWMTGSSHAQTPVPGSAGKPSRAEQAAILASVTEYAASYTRNLPNFTVTQIIERLTLPISGTRRASQPLLIEEQLSIVDLRETHKIVKLNGKAVTDMDEAALGQFSRGEFGNLLAAIFSIAANTNFEWDRIANLNGRPMHVFNFRVPAATGYELQARGRTIRVSYRGQVWADMQTSAVMRVQLSCVDIPGNSEYKALDLTVDYKATQVAGKSYILPSQNRMRIRTALDSTTQDSDYKFYRRFGAEATLVFEDSGDSAGGDEAGPPPTPIGDNAK